MHNDWVVVLLISVVFVESAMILLMAIECVTLRSKALEDQKAIDKITEKLKSSGDAIEVAIDRIPPLP